MKLEWTQTFHAEHLINLWMLITYLLENKFEKFSTSWIYLSAFAFLLSTLKNVRFVFNHQSSKLLLTSYILYCICGFLFSFERIMLWKYTRLSMSHVNYIICPMWIIFYFVIESYIWEKYFFFYLLACLFSFSISMPMLFLIKLGLDEEKKIIYEFVIWKCFSNSRTGPTAAIETLKWNEF